MNDLRSRSSSPPRCDPVRATVEIRSHEAVGDCVKPLQRFLRTSGGISSDSCQLGAALLRRMYSLLRGRSLNFACHQAFIHRAYITRPPLVIVLVSHSYRFLLPPPSAHIATIFPRAMTAHHHRRSTGLLSFFLAAAHPSENARLGGLSRKHRDR